MHHYFFIILRVTLLHLYHVLVCVTGYYKLSKKLSGHGSWPTKRINLAYISALEESSPILPPNSGSEDHGLSYAPDVNSIFKMYSKS